jgi:hypothetical protein
MSQTDRMEQLKAFLGALPDAAAVRLAQAIEFDRLRQSSRLPHAQILDGLRPALRRAAATRTLTPLRLFCQPFEDMLVDLRGAHKQTGRIARSSIAPVWRWLAETLRPEETASFVNETRTALLRQDAEPVQAEVESFWALAGESLRSALADELPARAALGSEAVAADAREMSLMLMVGPQIAPLQGQFRKGLPALTDDLLWVLRGVYDRVVESCPDAAPYVGVLAMNRLAQPWQALKLPLMIARHSDDTLISSTDMGVVGEILLGDLQSHGTAICAVRPPQFDAEALALLVSRFARISSGVVAEIELRRDGRWSQRLFKDRAAVSEVMNALVRRASRDILAALPTIRSGAYAGGPTMPDLRRGPDMEKSERALNAARLIAGCRACAAAACFGAAEADADEEASSALKRYSEEIVRQMRLGDEARRCVAVQYCELAASLVAILFSTEEAEFLRRRARAAKGEPAQAA